jgi:hypothetical protein
MIAQTQIARLSRGSWYFKGAIPLTPNIKDIRAYEGIPNNKAAIAATHVGGPGRCLYFTLPVCRRRYAASARMRIVISPRIGWIMGGWYFGT